MTSVAARPLINERRCPCGRSGVFGYELEGRWRWYCADHRLRRWSADARISEAESNRAHAELGIETVGPPDLQALVAAHGSYDRITPEAWAEYDRAMEAYHAARREKYRRR